MARGWESKAVEDQIAAAAENRTAVRNGPDLDPKEREHLSKKGNLQLARSRVLEQLQGACDRRYRAHLEQSLTDIDAQLDLLGASASSTP